MRARFRGFGTGARLSRGGIGSNAPIAPGDEASHSSFSRLGGGIAISLLAFAVFTASAVATQADAHPTGHTPKQAFATGVKCAAGAAALAARFPADETSRAKERALEMVEKERKLAIAEGAGLSIPKTEVEQRIQTAQNKITLAAYKPDHGIKPADGKINQRIFYPLLDCELLQLGDEIAAKKSDQNLKSDKP